MASSGDDWRNRISIDANICHGKPCIAGTRVLVHILVSCAENGETEQRILAAHPGIAKEDLDAAFRFAQEEPEVIAAVWARDAAAGW